MNDDHLNDRLLQRLIDDELASPERSKAWEHLRGCARCNERFNRLDQLVRAIGALPTAIEPPIDPWPGIQARIQEAPRIRRSGSTLRPPSSRRPGWPFHRNAVLATAAALLIGVALGRLVIPARDAPPLSAPLPNATSLLASYDQPAYDTAVAELENLLSQRKDELRPETVAAIEENLAIIDRAIADAREALRADPANEYLNQHLSSTMQAKLQLLRTIIEI